MFFPDAALPSDLRRFPTDETLRFGDLSVTAIPVDHAAPDSRALLFEADGQRLLYILIEGTTLGSSGGGLSAESDADETLVELARDHRERLVAVVASGQNVDRLVSCFRAAKRGRRLLVIDPYQAYVLMKLAPLSKSIPQFTGDGVRVSFAPHQVERLKQAGMMDLVYEMSEQGKVTNDQLAAGPGGYLMCSRGGYGMTKVFDKVGADEVVLAWSMWSGYWERDGCAMRE